MKGQGTQEAQTTKEKNTHNKLYVTSDGKKFASAPQVQSVLLPTEGPWLFVEQEREAAERPHVSVPYCFFL